jgi:regulator of sirC expression with transglutaminase-like and TPR domain
MFDPKQLPYLIKLLDDESEIVQKTVMSELSSFGAELRVELARQNIILDFQQKQILHELLASQNQMWIQENWPRWMSQENDKEKLEMALSLLAEFQYERNYPVTLTFLLDQLAEEYISTYPARDSLRLSEFLFEIKNIRGAEADYNNPMNSNLNYVIEKKRGVPISLACIYILVGHRLGMDIHGLNYPGHFLTRAHSGEKNFIVDCFNHGRYVDEDRLDTLNNPGLLTREKIVSLECRADIIIGRILRNLINAYQLQSDESNIGLMTSLLSQMPKDP